MFYSKIPNIDLSVIFINYILVNGLTYKCKFKSMIYINYNKNRQYVIYIIVKLTSRWCWM